MMLNTFLPNVMQRYVFAGSVVGVAIPLCYYTAAAIDHGIEEAFRLFTSHSLLALGVTLPVAATVAAYRLARLRRVLSDRLSALESREEQLRRDALFDRMTGIANRLSLEIEIGRLAAVAGEEEAPALMLLDLDRFKFINDTLGHDVGDELLIALSMRLNRLVGGRGQLFRLGGDEFVILLTAGTSAAELEAFCQAVESSLNAPFDLIKGRVATGVSIGVTLMNGKDTMSTVLKRADLALYKAKEKNGSAHAFYSREMADESLVRFEIERDLSRALADGELFLEYQPIIGVTSRAVRSFEALLRWRHPVKGVIQPDHFLPFAEKTGMILPIGNWVMRVACMEAAKWPAPTGVAVNVAGDQFKDRGFVDHVKACLDEAGLAPGRLTIEITESVFTVDVGIIRESLTALRALGVRIALDDFGTGFSSISNLRQFPLDHLKIDRSFTQLILTSQQDANLVDLILKLGDTFHVSTTIEGIETEGQLEFVKNLGIAEAQGFLISKPVPAEEVMPFITRLLQQGDMQTPQAVA